MAFLKHENIKVLQQRLKWQRNGLLNQLISVLKEWTYLELRHCRLRVAV